MSVSQNTRPKGLSPRSTVAPRRTRLPRLRRLLYVVLALCLSGAAVLLGVGWYFSSQLLDVAPHRLSYAQRVVALHSGAVVLTRSDDSMKSEVDGLVWSGGRSIVGPIISATRTTVTRQMIGTLTGLGPGTPVALDDHVYTSPAALHIQYRAAKVPDRLGPMPAWFVPGSRTTWAVFVHGYTSNRADWLRALPTPVRLGLPSLLVSYRNDVGAPASRDHLYHLGATEWQDLEAGVKYALAHGAHSVIVFGSSMGGNIVEAFLGQSHYASRVRAVVLDAPVLDWSAALDQAAANRHLPDILTAVAKRMVAFRLGLPSLDSINQVKSSANPRVPTLVFHGTADTTAPIRVSASFARAHPGEVTLVRVAGAGHTESWNVNPREYASTLRLFLRRVLGA